jgi:hypothetical protein
VVVAVPGGVGMLVRVPVTFLGMRVRMIRVMAMKVRMRRAVRMGVDVLVIGNRGAVDPRFTGTATAGRAHARSPRPIAPSAAIVAVHSMAISLSRMSLPATTCSW